MVALKRALWSQAGSLDFPVLDEDYIRRIALTGCRGVITFVRARDREVFENLQRIYRIDELHMDFMTVFA